MSTNQNQLRTIWHGGSPFEKYQLFEATDQKIENLLKKLVVRPHVARWSEYNQQNFKDLLLVKPSSFMRRSTPKDYWGVAKGLEILFGDGHATERGWDAYDIMHQRALIAVKLKLHPREIVVGLESAAVLYGAMNTTPKTTFFIPMSRLNRIKDKVEALTAGKAWEEGLCFEKAADSIFLYALNSFHIQTVDSLRQHLTISFCEKSLKELDSWIRQRSMFPAELFVHIGNAPVQHG